MLPDVSPLSLAARGFRDPLVQCHLSESSLVEDSAQRKGGNGDADSLCLLPRLGVGGFGSVHKGYYAKMPAAVKLFDMTGLSKKDLPKDGLL